MRGIRARLLRELEVDRFWRDTPVSSRYTIVAYAILVWLAMPAVALIAGLAWKGVGMVFAFSTVLMLISGAFASRELEALREAERCE